MKPLKDEEAADGISRKQSQNAVYQTCATLACGEALAAANADPTSVTQGGCGVNYGRRVGKCCLSAFKIATKSNHKSRLQHIFLIYIQIMT